MRKETKLGLAIGGGVLLLGAISLMLFPGAPGAGERVSRDVTDVEVSLDSASRESVSDPRRDPPTTTQRTTRRDAATADTREPTAERMPSDAAETTVESDVDADDEDRRQAWDWVRMLETGDIHPLMGQTPTDVPEADAIRSTGSGGADAADSPDESARRDEPEPRERTGVGFGTTRSHTVRENETLSSIALSYYGRSSYWSHIAEANPEIDPNRMRTGTVLRVPPVSEAAPASERLASSREIDPRREYRVEDGDSLYTISLQLYGQANRVDDLYELNRKAIGPDPARLRLDMVLRLPEAPTTTASSQ